MTDSNAVELIKRSEQRFSRRAQLDGFRQEVALNFAPWHASWQSELQLGSDFCAHLIDGTPLLVARDFIGQIGAMLRPPGKQWFWHRSAIEKVNNNARNREYLDWRSAQMMRVMTDRVTGFSRAMKMSDEFFGLFGDAVISVDASKMQDSLRVRTWHSKDCAWVVGAENKVDTITRREMMPARVMAVRFERKKLHQKVLEALDKNPDQEFEVRHDVMPSDEYDTIKGEALKRKPGQGYASIWTDVSNKTILSEATTATFRYVIPRWVTLPNWAYAISPVTTIALPDARLIQQQAVAILEAAEKSINPPLVAYQDAIRGDIRLESLGITWVDRTYDERQGAPVTPLELGKNFQLGVESLIRTQHQLTKAFFLDTLRMPDTRNSKSTEEVRFMIDEYVRAALPLFAPMREEYSDALLFEVDAMIDVMGGYDDQERPKGLDKEAMVFAWDNPLSDMIERQKAQLTAEVAQIGNTIAALEAAAAQAPSLKQVNTGKLAREAWIGIGAAPYLLDEEEAAQQQDGQNQANTMQQAIAAAPNMAQLIDSGVNAAQAASEIPNPAEPGFALPMPV